MDDRETLLEAIRRDPSDSLAWLALADRLDEEGQPERAHLLRLTRRLQALAPDDPARRPLEAELAALLIRGVRPCLPEAVNSVGMRFVLAPPGAAWTAPPEDYQGHATGGPAREISFAAPFWIGKYPVTQAE